MRQRHHPRIGPLKTLNWTPTQHQDTPLGVTLTRTAPITTLKDEMFQHWQEHRAHLRRAGYSLTPRGHLWFITQTTVPKQDKSVLRRLMRKYITSRTYFPTPKASIASIPHQHAPAVLTAWEALKSELEAEGFELIRISRDKWSISAPPKKVTQVRAETPKRERYQPPRAFA